MQASAASEKLEVGDAKGLTSKSRGGLPTHGSPSMIASQPLKFFANKARSAIVISSSLGSLCRPRVTCLSPLKLSHYCCVIGEGFGWLGSAIRMRIV